MGYLEESDGSKKSASRAVMFVGVGMILAVWLGAIGWILVVNWGRELDTMVDVWNGTGLGDALQFGVVVMFGTLMPYVMNKVTGAKK